ncbi:hypothetical protein BT67DRAFT_443501 [Trichocladium antarcticum]|uniref:Uncharacterized protein n=1 Tax=Trichocladium antarcticum TaxID=1450529 RepID=A0AAN6UHG1_9PEZI|nr:hypothetical protein BT67DRAFT_443501 [Trichocladium antarcticum]
MPRQVDNDVHSAFMEFRAGQNEKCLSVQCIYCQQVRAKNTTRQKQHLLQCSAYLHAHPDVAIQASAATVTSAPPAPPAPSVPSAVPVPALPAAPPAHDVVAHASSHEDIAGEHSALSFMPNPRINGSPSQGRPSLGGGEGTPAPKRQKTMKPTPGSNTPEIPLADVHAAFVEFRANDDDKCMSARCLYCNQIRAKNTSRQREHLLSCPGYQAMLKDKIPAASPRHQFDDDDVASSLAIPAPGLELDFRMSIRVKPKLNVGAGTTGRQSWVSCIGGQWAGRFGKGVLLPGGQDMQTTVKDTATRIDARYLMQTGDEHPALIICTVKGWLNGDRDVMERLQDPVAADNVTAHRYQLRATIELETGDERYAAINTGTWLASGCRRGAEIVYDAYRIS